jgi:hypothetical protein
LGAVVTRPRYTPVAGEDLADALKVLRRGFGPDAVTVLTVTPHDDPAALAKVARRLELFPEFGEEDHDR